MADDSSTSSGRVVMLASGYFDIVLHAVNEAQLPSTDDTVSIAGIFRHLFACEHTNLLK